MQHWKTKNDNATMTERNAYVLDHAASVTELLRARLGKAPAMEIPGQTWTDEELLPLELEPPVQGAHPRALAQAAAVLAMLSILWQTARSARTAADGAAA